MKNQGQSNPPGTALQSEPVCSILTLLSSVTVIMINMFFFVTLFMLNSSRSSEIKKQLT
jgi:hypothetical protein